MDEKGLTRRELVVLGGIGAAKLTTKNGGMKAVVLPQEGANDPVSLSVADSLFWTDIMRRRVRCDAKRC